MPVRTSLSAASLAALGAREILGGGDLHVAAPRLRMSSPSRPAHSASAASSVKSSRPAAARADARRAGQAKAKACGVCTVRSCRAVDASPVTVPAASTRLHRVGDRESPGPRRRSLPRGRDRAADQRLRGERPRRVVHQHELGRGARVQAPRARRAPTPDASPHPAPAAAGRAPRPRPGRRAASSGWTTGCTRSNCRVAGELAQARAGPSGPPRILCIAWENRAPARGPRPAATTTAATHACHSFTRSKIRVGQRL